jgi:16S rRNA (cytosine1402-N4)-methyltransferase
MDTTSEQLSAPLRKDLGSPRWLIRISTLPRPTVRDSGFNTSPHRRRPRYAGKYPRRFSEKYKEHNPERYGTTVEKVLASGKTPAGMHRPIMVAEVLEALKPAPGQVLVDCTLGYGGHTLELLRRIQPGGRVIGLDADPIELPRTAERIRTQGFGPEIFTAVRSNFAGILQVLGQMGIAEVDGVLADLGVSSMQLDNPGRGFTMKEDGPLDMRMNPNRGLPASAWLERITPAALERTLRENADEPRAQEISLALAVKRFSTTGELVLAIQKVVDTANASDRADTVRRVFQALRIAVNEEFSALDTLLRNLPSSLKPGGRAVFLTFHSGEDRRVKHAFAEGRRSGIYSRISEEVLRASAAERHDNPRSTPAKLRWAERGPQAS